MRTSAMSECDATRAEAVTLDGMVAVLAGPGPLGVGPVNRLLIGLAAAVEAGENSDAVAVTTELARRYLRAVRCHAGGAPVARSWLVVFEGWDPSVTSPLRATLAGATTLVGNDLAPAVVSACTLQGRAPGPVECRAADTIAVALADLVHDAVREAGGCDPAGVEAAHELIRVLARRDPWRLAEHLWTLRGRPAEAAAEQTALDQQCSAVGRALLRATPAP